MKGKKTKTYKILLLCSVVCIFIVALFLGMCVYLMSPVSKKSNEKLIVVESGDSVIDIAHLLKEENLIRNEQVFVYYARLRKANNIYAASYYLNQNMSVDDIIDTLLEGGHNANEIRITFNEGINMRKIASIISSETDNSYEDVMNLLKDTKYIDSLIDKYWFLTDDIKNESIYYPLEGYLYPSTYFFSGKDVSVSDIFTTMLDEMDNVLSEYKDEIKNSKYSIHELMTLASVTQSEGYDVNDFKNIASVFYNRLEDGTPLGSCVTSYYGVKKEMTDELLMSDINASNAYNTRGDNPRKMPVGPISSPSSDAIDATLKPITTSYYYFVSDKNHKLYFTKTYTEHENKIAELMDEGLWYEW